MPHCRHVIGLEGCGAVHFTALRQRPQENNPLSETFGKEYSMALPDVSYDSDD